MQVDLVEPDLAELDQAAGLGEAGLDLAEAVQEADLEADLVGFDLV